MHRINIENKAFAEFGTLTVTELAVAKTLRGALLNGADQVACVAEKLACIADSVGGSMDVVHALHLLEAEKHGELLRERTVAVEVCEADGEEWVADGLLLKTGEYLSVYLLGSDRVLDVLSPSDMHGCGYGPSDIADEVEHIRIDVDPCGDLNQSELTDGEGREWCQFEHEWC